MSEYIFVTNIFEYSNIFATLWSSRVGANKCKNAKNLLVQRPFWLDPQFKLSPPLASMQCEARAAIIDELFVGTVHTALKASVQKLWFSAVHIVRTRLCIIFTFTLDVQCTLCTLYTGTLYVYVYHLFVCSARWLVRQSLTYRHRWK